MSKSTLPPSKEKLVPLTTRSTTTLQQTGRSRRSNSLSKKALINVDRRYPTHDPKETHKFIDELLEEKKRVDRKLVSNTHSFKDVLIYCKKTIENQDFQIERLDESLKKQEDSYEEKLRKERQRAQDEVTEMKLSIERLNTENLMMKTQLGNLEQLELELREAQMKIEELGKELEEKNEKIGKRELKERELIIITTEKVRKQLEVEFAQEVEKMKKELHIQNMALLEANQQVVKKVKVELQKVLNEKDDVQLSLKHMTEELETKMADYVALEKEKKRLDRLIQRINEQTEKRMTDFRQNLERLESRIRLDSENREKEIVESTQKIEELSALTENQKSRIEEVAANFEKEREQNILVNQKLSEQNRKINTLRQFLETVFENNNDNYIDLMLGENRQAIFAKLTTLLRTIPILSEEPINERSRRRV